MSVTKTNEQACPSCGYLMDALSPVKEDLMPEEGDLSICFQCAAYFKLGKNLERISLPNSEFNQLPADVRRQLSDAKLAIRLRQWEQN